MPSYKIVNDERVPLTAEEEAELAGAMSKSDTISRSEGYKKSRLGEYPAIGDQLDALFHAGVFPAEMAAKIQAVKDKYPKPQ